MDARQPNLQDQISAILRIGRVDTPLRAADIVRKLAEAGTIVNKESVNKVLYKGPFERVGAGVPPIWKVREIPLLVIDKLPPRVEGHFSFAVEGVGAFYLRDTLTENQLESFLTLVATLIPDGAPRVVRLDTTTELGATGQMAARMVARLAREQRLAVEPLDDEGF